MRSEYNDLLESELSNSQHIMISQSITDGRISTILAKDARFSPRPPLIYKNLDAHSTFMEFVSQQKLAGKHVHSLACDDKFGYGVVVMSGFGRKQEVTRDYKMSTRLYSKGYRITACGAQCLNFYYIMTKGVDAFDGKKQMWVLKKSWAEMEDLIEDNRKRGMTVTDVCYSRSKKKYLLVMTKSLDRQKHRWRVDDKVKDDKWIEEESSKGRYPSIIFHDPSTGRVLDVTTESVDRSGFRVRARHFLSLPPAALSTKLQTSQDGTTLSKEDSPVTQLSFMDTPLIQLSFVEVMNFVNFKVRVVCACGNNEMVIKLLPDTKMVRLKKIYADFVGLSVKQLKFFFKSREVKDGDSADKLGMKNGEKIRTKKTRKVTPSIQQKVAVDCLSLFDKEIKDATNQVEGEMVEKIKEVNKEEESKKLEKIKEESLPQISETNGLINDQVEEVGQNSESRYISSMYLKISNIS